MEKINLQSLRQKATQLRLKTLDLALEKGGGHIGGSFSEIEILVSLYDCILKPEDKFLLGKGHACYPFYVLLNEKGYNPKISGHPDIDEKNGIYCTSGSLGHALPIGTGMALARKLQKKPGKIYVLLSDGECQEGTTWEASDIACFYKLDNLVAIVDYNKIQALDKIENVSPMNLNSKFDSFGWHVEEVDGHDFKDLISTLKKRIKNKPSLILGHTIKGKGVSYIENNPAWHAKQVTRENIKEAYQELNKI